MPPMPREPRFPDPYRTRIGLAVRQVYHPEQTPVEHTPVPDPVRRETNCGGQHVAHNFHNASPFISLIHV